MQPRAPDDLTGEQFARLNSRLLGIAYRMLGSWGDAEDVAGEAWLRWQQHRGDDIADVQAWLVTTATRISIDRWRTLTRRRETYLGPWLPEPVDPALLPYETAEQRQSLAIGLLHLMERLTVRERAAFVLRYAFDHDYAEIGAMLDRTADSCRQLAHRARRKLDISEHDPGPAREHQAALEALIRAVRSGRRDDVVALITKDAVLLADGGGLVKSALRPILGADRIARFLLGISAKTPITVRIVTINDGPAAVVEFNQSRRVVQLSLAADGISADGISVVRLYGNPEKLRHLPR